jgi:SdrD B-like domain
MTRHVKRAYRRSRWAAVLVVLTVVALGAIAIPFASGAPGKFYTLTYDPSGSSQAVCLGETVDVTLKLSNEAKTQSLGSANITFPGFVSVTGTPTASTGTISRSGNIVMLRNLDLPRRTGVVTLTVSVEADTLGSGPIEAIVKQANDFNDSGGDANLFELQGAFPTLTVEDCTGTIEGTVWRDSNESGTLDGTEIGQSGWDVYLYRGGSDVDMVTTDAGGDYIFENVPLNHDYVVCEEAPGGSWIQSTPGTEPATCAANGHEDAGYSFSFTESIDGKDFGNVNTVQVDCASTDPADLQFYTETADSTYTVQIQGGDLCNKSAEYVFEAYAENSAERVANFHSAAGGTGTVQLVERMTWVFSGTDQPDPANRSLKYDDDASDGINPVPMPYCLKDPRLAGEEFLLDPSELTGVLPSGATSCLITTTESAGGDRTDFAYTEVDGYRLWP